MKNKGSILEWNMTLAETLAFGVTLVTMTLWVMATFVEKTSADEFAEHVDKRFNKHESFELRLDSKIDKIEDDVAVIRGILEAQRRERQ